MHNSAFNDFYVPGGYYEVPDEFYDYDREDEVKEVIKEDQFYHMQDHFIGVLENLYGKYQPLNYELLELNLNEIAHALKVDLPQGNLQIKREPYHLGLDDMAEH